MAKRSAKLSSLTARGRQIMAYIFTAIAFKTHGDDCELETMAKALDTTAGRLRPAIRKLAAGGWLTLEQKSLEFVYPTAAALMHQSDNLSRREADAIIRKLQRR